MPNLPVLKIVCGEVVSFDGIKVEELFKSKTRIVFQCKNFFYVYKIDIDSLHLVNKGDIYTLLIKLVSIGSNMKFTLVDA